MSANNTGSDHKANPESDAGGARRRQGRRRSEVVKATRGMYCCVPKCSNSSDQRGSRQLKGLPRLSFHSFPGDKAKKTRRLWLRSINRDVGANFRISKYTKVCSAHFRPEDFACGGNDPDASRRVLLPGAVPTMFPWSPTSVKRTTHVSERASLLSMQVELQPEVDDSRCKSSHEVDNKNDWMFMEDRYGDSDLVAEIDRQRMENNELRAEVKRKEETIRKSKLRLDNIKDNDEKVRFYTGFPDYDTLLAFNEEILESDSKVMRQWRGKETKGGCKLHKSGAPSKLPLMEQFFMVLVRLRLGLLEYDLAERFDVAQSTVSRLIMTWVNLMYHAIKDNLARFPPAHVVEKYMPKSFKNLYPRTRVILDATELEVERPSSLRMQAKTFSAYQNTNTMKFLVGITPSGAVSFVSPTYEGSISDKNLTKESGIIDLLNEGDEVMADKGFEIQDLLAPVGVRLNQPPFLDKRRQMPVEDIVHTRKIANLRIHVERAIARVEHFRILRGVIPGTLWDCVNEIVFVCCMLTNFNPPLCC